METLGADEAAVIARDASYRAGGYRSFEYATFTAAFGDVTALLGADVAAPRDLALACAGVVRPSEGSLSVVGVEIASGERLPRGLAGVGVFSGMLDVSPELTVEETVRREFRLRRAGEVDVLPYLAKHGIATHAEHVVSSLEPAARARLSGALACAGGARIATLDLDDPFIGGMSTSAARDIVEGLRAFAEQHAVCIVVATRDADIASACDEAYALDFASEEELRAKTRAVRGTRFRKGPALMEVGAV